MQLACVLDLAWTKRFSEARPSCALHFEEILSLFPCGAENNNPFKINSKNPNQITDPFSITNDVGVGV